MKKITEIDYISTKAIIERLEDDKKEVCNSLLNEISFMSKTLNELKKNVEENGVVVEMCQGKYNIERANPALNQYNALIKNYTSCIKQLNDLLPKDDLPKDEDFDDDDLCS